jgi:hypothetical protein
MGAMILKNRGFVHAAGHGLRRFEDDVWAKKSPSGKEVRKPEGLKTEIDDSHHP